MKIISDPAPRRRQDFTLTMINIVFLLLLFFLTTGSLSNREETQATVPETHTLPMERLPRPLLLLETDGRLLLDGQAVSRVRNLSRPQSGQRRRPAAPAAAQHTGAARHGRRNFPQHRRNASGQPGAAANRHAAHPAGSGTRRAMTARSQTGLWAVAAAGSIALHLAAGMILYAMPMPDGPKTVRTEINIAAVSTGDSQVRHSRKRHGRQSAGQCDRGAPVGDGGARGRKHCPRANARAPICRRPAGGPKRRGCRRACRACAAPRSGGYTRTFAGAKRRPKRRQREKQHPRSSCGGRGQRSAGAFNSGGGNPGSAVRLGHPVFARRRGGAHSGGRTCPGASVGFADRGSAASIERALSVRVANGG